VGTWGDDAHANMCATFRLILHKPRGKRGAKRGGRGENRGEYSKRKGRGRGRPGPRPGRGRALTFFSWAADRIRTKICSSRAAPPRVTAARAGPPPRSRPFPSHPRVGALQERRATRGPRPGLLLRWRVPSRAPPASHIHSTSNSREHTCSSNTRKYADSKRSNPRGFEVAKASGKIARIRKHADPVCPLSGGGRRAFQVRERGWVVVLSK
jgi:hypothetical protein